MTTVFFFLWTTVGIAAGMIVAEIFLIMAVRSRRGKSVPRPRPEQVSPKPEQAPAGV